MALAAVFVMGGCDRYKVERQGNLLVRVDRFTGKTETFIKDGAGSGHWQTVAEQAPPAVQAAQRVQRDLPATDLALLTGEVGFVGGMAAGSPVDDFYLLTARQAGIPTSQKLSYTMTNGSAWEITQVTMRFAFGVHVPMSIVRTLTVGGGALQDGTEVPSLAGLTVAPGATYTFETYVEPTLSSWALVAAKGYPPAR